MDTPLPSVRGGLFFSFFLLLSLLVLFPRDAFGCSCVAGQSQEEAFEEADAVFSGQVRFIESTDGERLVTFDTGVVWKGEESRMYEILTADNSAACGYAFTEGEWYVVYAYKRESGALATGDCSRTASLDASQDLLALGDGVNPDGVVNEDGGLSDVDAWDWLDKVALFLGILFGSLIFQKYVYPKLKEQQETNKRK